MKPKPCDHNAHALVNCLLNPATTSCTNFKSYREQRVDCENVSGIFLLPPQCYNRFSSIRGTTLATSPTCGAPDFQLSLSLYRDTLSLLRHSSSCILCGISNSFIQIHIANSCTCFSCASLIRTMRYNAAGAQLHCAPDRTLGYAILFSLPFSPKHIGALRVHELRFRQFQEI